MNDRHTTGLAILVLIAAVGSLLCLTPWAAAADPEGVVVGVAKVDVTPETPVRMYGYAARKTESEGVAGPLTAKALAIGDDADPGPAVLLTVDCGAVPRAIRDEVFRRVAAKHPIRPERFVLCNSHNHSGPNLKGMESIDGAEHERLAKYAGQLTDRLESVVLAALASRRPASLAWTQGSVGFAANRRVLNDGKWTGFGAVPEGPVDHSLPVLRVSAADGTLMAVVVNYACHNTTLRGDFKQIHGDWAACAQAEIEADHPAALALITIGCGADADPCPHGTVALCQEHGRALADEVARLLKQAAWQPVPAPLVARRAVLEIPYGEQAAAAQPNPVAGPEKRPEAPANPKSETFQITTWTFADTLAMVFFSDEVVVDYSRRLKQELRGSRLWISAYTDDVSRYIVSKRLLGEGGYEVSSSLSSRLTDGHPDQLEPAMEDRVVGAVESLLPASFKSIRPIALHPDNPHYFLWRDKPTILVTSGEHYGALLNLDFDFRRYFHALTADGLNHTRTFSGTYREVASSFGITDNPLAPQPGRYLCPWPRSDQPGYYDGGNKFDLKRFDPQYVARLREFMQAAGAAGVVVEFNLFCPLYKDELWDASPMNSKNNVDGIGNCPRTEALTLKHSQLVDVQLAMVRHVVRALNEFDNLYYEVCNEPYFGGVAMDWQHRVVDTIVEVEKSLPQKHLISMNIANGQARVENPHRGVSILNFHYCVPPDTVAMNRHCRCVVGENETGFRGRHDLLYRSEGWDFLLAGGGLYNNLDYSFTPKHPDGTFLDYSSPGGGSPALRRQLGILKRFLEGFDFVHMQPDRTVIKSVRPELTGYALIEPGRQYGVYLHVPLPKNPKQISDYLNDGVQAEISIELPEGSYRLEWIDTRTGEVAKAESLDHQGGPRELQSPKFANDVALRILRNSP